MSDTEQTQQAQDAEQGEQQKHEATFTQADVDKLIRERLQRERSKYSDYDELKARAGEAKTLEDRMADLERQAVEANARALRSDVAARFSISSEDRDLFLTATDEDTLVAQAKRLSERESEQKKRNSNHVPREGSNPRPSNDPWRDLQRQVFADKGE